METLRPNALEYMDVSFAYGRAPDTVKEISFGARRGSVSAIIGPSGSGKTTLLRLAIGLEIPTSGEIRVSLPGRPRSAALAYVSQNLDLCPHLTALQNILLPLSVGYGWEPRLAEKRAFEVAESLKISELMKRFPYELSGGQRQRVAIARAVAVEPMLLLLDEITAALDPETTSEVLSALVKMKPIDQTIVVVTHHLGFAAHAADTVVFIDQGRLIEITSGSNLLSNPMTLRLQKFVAHYR